MPVRFNRLLVPGSVALVACGGALTAPSGELPYATATNSCGTTDGPAVSITLLSSLAQTVVDYPPFVTVSIWKPLGDLPGNTFRLATGSEDGYGAFYAEGSRRAGAVTGTVSIYRVARDSSVTGFVDLLLIDGSRIRQEFSAPWTPTRTRCG